MRLRWYLVKNPDPVWRVSKENYGPTEADWNANNGYLRKWFYWVNKTSEYCRRYGGNCEPPTA